MQASYQNKVIVLTIDASTKSSGWSVFSDGSLLDYGVIVAGGTHLFHRIDKMIKELSSIVEKYKPNKVVIEDVIPDDVSHNNNVYKALVYLQGYILHMLDDYGISDYKFFTSSEWRSKCGIKTGAGIRRDSLKPKDVAFVKSQYGLEVNDDIADAICIGYAYFKKEEKIEIDGFEFK